MKLRGFRSLRVGARDHGVGVGGVAHHQHADVAVRDFVHGLALRRENLRVGHQQVFTFHAGAARARADQQGGVAVLERDSSIVGGDDLVEQSETRNR